VRLLVTVKNTGLGRAIHTEAVLRNGMGQEGIMISAGRFDAKDMGPGETKTFSFVYEVRPEFKGDDYQLELAVGDTVLGESVTDKIKIKVAPAGPAPEAASGTATVTRDEAPLRETAKRGGARRRPRAEGHDVQDQRQAGDVHAPRPRQRPLRLRLDGRRQVGRHGARHACAGVAGDAARPHRDGADRRPGRDGPPQGARHRRARRARRLRARLEPQREDPREEGLLPAEPARGRPARRWTSRPDIPLWPGSNLVQVFARESNEVQSLQTVVVLKRAGRQRPRGPATDTSAIREKPAQPVKKHRTSGLGPRASRL
jgi:hypothetical protein